MDILVVNCGSSSVKLQLFDVDENHLISLARGTVERIGAAATLVFHGMNADEIRREERIEDWGTALGALLELLRQTRTWPPRAIGHRVVHGGAFCQPAVIDDSVITAIDRARRFAPLHNEPALEGIRAAQRQLPNVPMVAVFDTAFHATMPETAAHYALPQEIVLELGVRRYGYHGIAHRSMTERFAELTHTPPDDVAIITLQLGNGCSAAAVRGHASADTSMGFTPMEGLVMGTRPGDLDPAVVTYLQREQRMPPDEVDTMLNHRSGLLGVSGSTADMAALLEQESRGDARAHAAIELFCYRARKYIGAYIAVLGTPQAVVFGGGIGERAPEIRRRICEPLAPLGIVIDGARNAALVGGEGRFSDDASRIAVWTIPSDEERIIARDTHDALVR